MPLLRTRADALFAGCFAIGLALCSGPAAAQDSVIRSVSAAPAYGYSDIADLADASPLVLRAEVRKAVRLKPEQAPGLPAGMARVYVEARTVSLLFGPAIGETVRYLADVPLDAKGKLPKLKKAQVLVFARPVPGRPGELALTAPDAQLTWTPALESTARAILTELVSPEAPPRIKGLREALHVRGNLAGEGETQLFLATENGAPISLTVIRRPGQPPAWGVSFSEIVDQAARPPAPQTLAWYRLACFLPDALPASAVLSGSGQDRQIAAEDFALVRRSLGPCGRTRGLPQG